MRGSLYYRLAWIFFQHAFTRGFSILFTLLDMFGFNLQDTPRFDLRRLEAVAPDILLPQLDGSRDIGGENGERMTTVRFSRLPSPSHPSPLPFPPGPARSGCTCLWAWCLACVGAPSYKVLGCFSVPWCKGWVEPRCGCCPWS